MLLRPLFIFALTLLLTPAVHAQRLSRVADAGIEFTDTAASGLRFHADGRTVELAIERHTRIEDELAPYAAPVARGEHRYFRGSVPAVAGSWARLALIDQAWIGAVWDGETLWLFDPARQHASLARAAGIALDGTVMFTLADVELPAGFDHGDAGHGNTALSVPGHPDAVVSPHASLPAGVDRFLRLTLVLDTEFQALHGANAASVAGAVLNIADGFYSNQVGVDVSLFHLRALSSNGTLTATNPDALLNAFRSYVGGGNVPFSGLAHLLSGKDFDGITIGLAYLGTVCNNGGFGTGINQITFSQALGGATLAHEMGHNFNAEHDSQGNACPSSGFIMASVLNLSSPASQFSSCSLTYFTQYLAQPLTCLNGPPDLIFAHGFQ